MFVHVFKCLPPRQPWCCKNWIVDVFYEADGTATLTVSFLEVVEIIVLLWLIHWEGHGHWAGLSSDAEPPCQYPFLISLVYHVPCLQPTFSTAANVRYRYRRWKEGREIHTSLMNVWESRGYLTLVFLFRIHSILLFSGLYSGISSLVQHCIQSDNLSISLDTSSKIFSSNFQYRSAEVSSITPFRGIFTLCQLLVSCNGRV